MARITYDYTDRDYAALRNRLQALSRQQFPGWTDFNEANFGNHFLKLMAFVGDLVGFYQDNQGGESRITTATQRRSMIGLLKLLGYRMQGATAAMHEEQFTLAAIQADNVVLPIGTTVKTRESVPTEFQLLEEVTIIAGGLSATGTVEHSKTHDEPDTELDGSPNQSVRLSQIPFLDGSLVSANGGYVRVEGLDYTEVDNFLNSTAADRHFTVSVDESDRAFLLFGNGINGIAPQGTLQVRYKTGGGTVGNVEAGSIKEIVGTFTTIGGSPVTITVSNPDGPTVLGTDRETVEQARVNGPASIRANTRTVSRTDFEDNARLVDGVARALAITKNEDPTVVSLENRTNVYIVPTGGGAASDETKSAVLTMFTETRPVMTTHSVQVLGAVYKTFNIVAWVYLASGAVASTVRQAIQDTLEEWFEPTISDTNSDLFGLPNPNVNFGFYAKNAADEPEPLIRWSDIHDLLKVAGVRKLGTPADSRAMTVNGVADDVALELIEFPILGTVTIYNGDTGAIIELGG